MRWAPTSKFEHSNRELLALSICRDMAVFVVLEVSGDPRGVSGGSQGRPRGAQGRARASHGRPWGPRGVPGRTRGVPGVSDECPVDPRGPRGLWGRPGHPQDLFHKDDSVILFRNITPYNHPII